MSLKRFVLKILGYIRNKVVRLFSYVKRRVGGHLVGVFILKFNLWPHAKWFAEGRVGRFLLTRSRIYDQVGINFYSKYRFGKLIKFYNKKQELSELKKSRDFFSKLEGAYKGKRCFIIGNGPSLNEQDLTLLKNEFTIGSNYIYKNYESMGFVPTIFTIVNYLVAEQRIQEINNLGDTVKVFPFFLNYCVDNGKNTYFINSPAYNEFSKDINNYISWQSTVTFFNMQLAYFLGFDEVYLIGVDNSYIQPESGKEGAMIKQEEDDPNHFSKDYFRGLTWQKADPNAMEFVYLLSNEAYSQSYRKLYNATHGGRLEVFERMQYESLFNDKSKSVSQPLSNLLANLEVAEVPRKLVISINPDLKDKFGHFYHYDARVKNDIPDGVDFITFSNKALDEDVLKKNKWIFPVFSDHSWTLGRDSCRRTIIDYERFKLELINAYSVLDELYDEITIYFYTGSFNHALQIMKAVDLQKITSDIHINLFWEHFNFDAICAGEKNDLISKLNAHKKLYLYVDSHELSKVIEPFVTETYPIWPMFSVSDFGDSVIKGGAEKSDLGKTTVVFPGSLRLEKGYDLSLSAIEKLLSKSDVFNFKLRVGLNGRLNKEINSMRKRVSDKVEFVDGVLSDDEFIDFISGADIVVLPYRVSEFSTRTSGIMADCIMLKKPVVAAKSTWMGNIIERESNGEVYTDEDVDSMVEKILVVAANIESYKDSSNRLNKAWRNECHVNNFIKQVLRV